MKKTAREATVAAAEALVGLLPTAAPLTAAVYPHGSSLAEKVASAVVAAFVGSQSADVALVLVDTDALTVAAGTDSPVVSVADVLRPALEGAVAVLGVGVLGEARLEDAATLFGDKEARVFELSDRGEPVGWFAIRIRENGIVGSAPAQSAPIQSAPVQSAPVQSETVRTAAFQGAAMDGKLSRINNVEMALTVEIGRTRMSVRDVLSLEPGGVIELDRSAGAPADVLLNGRLIAHGEVVVVDQDYAVRITQILDVDEGLGA